MGSFWYSKNPVNNAAPKQTLLSATSGQDRPRRNIWSECVPARRWDKELFNNKMSFFFDFCFVAFLLWLVIFVASLFLLDGDWSLIFYAKFGKKIRKFALLAYIFLSVDSLSPVHVLLSRFYLDFILILSWFYPNFIQILSR